MWVIPVSFIEFIRGLSVRQIGWGAMAGVITKPALKEDFKASYQQKRDAADPKKDRKLTLIEAATNVVYGSGSTGSKSSDEALQCDLSVSHWLLQKADLATYFVGRRYHPESIKENLWLLFAPDFAGILAADPSDKTALSVMSKLHKYDAILKQPKDCMSRATALSQVLVPVDEKNMIIARGPFSSAAFLGDAVTKKKLNILLPVNLLFEIKEMYTDRCSVTKMIAELKEFAADNNLPRIIKESTKGNIALFCAPLQQLPDAAPGTYYIAMKTPSNEWEVVTATMRLEAMEFVKQLVMKQLGNISITSTGSPVSSACMNMLKAVMIQEMLRVKRVSDAVQKWIFTRPRNTFTEPLLCNFLHNGTILPSLADPVAVNAGLTEEFITGGYGVPFLPGTVAVATDMKTVSPLCREFTLECPAGENGYNFSTLLKELETVRDFFYGGDSSLDADIVASLQTIRTEIRVIGKKVVDGEQKLPEGMEAARMRCLEISAALASTYTLYGVPGLERQTRRVNELAAVEKTERMAAGAALKDKNQKKTTQLHTLVDATNKKLQLDDGGNGGGAAGGSAKKTTLSDLYMDKAKEGDEVPPELRKMSDRLFDEGQALQASSNQRLRERGDYIIGADRRRALERYSHNYQKGYRVVVSENRRFKSMDAIPGGPKWVD